VEPVAGVPTFVMVDSGQSRLQKIESTIEEVISYSSALKRLKDDTANFRTKTKMVALAKDQSGDEELQFKMNQITKKLISLESRFSELKKDIRKASVTLADLEKDKQFDKDRRRKSAALSRESTIFEQILSSFISIANQISVDLVNSPWRRAAIQLLKKLKEIAWFDKPDLKLDRPSQGVLEFGRLPAPMN